MEHAGDGSEILDVRNLRIEAMTETGNRVTLVDDVSFSLKPGEVLGLVGDSGAGAMAIGLSALAYARAGWRITGGRILFRGSDLSAFSNRNRLALRGANVAYVGQGQSAFNPALTILEQVCEVALQHRVMNRAMARAEAVRLFRELDLPKPETVGNRYPHQLSRGALQRAMAAMAMIAKPDLLVFDEPTAALDPTIQVDVLGSCKTLTREHGVAALYITSDLAVAAQVGDRVMVLREGKVVETGSAMQVLQQPQSDYARQLVVEQGPPSRVHSPDEVPILVGNKLTAYLGFAKAINDVAIELKRGDMLAVVGESGSGKGTLAGVILGLAARRSGELTLNGSNLPARVKDRTKDQLRRIQIIRRVLDSAFNPRRTLLEIIGRPVQLYFGRSRAEVRARVEALLQAVDLPPDCIARRPRELTDEQQLRVCIARALAAEPDIIICDAVTSALNPLAARDILRLLRRVQDRTGIAGIHITHDFGVARQGADTVMVMQKGKVVASGPIEQILSPPYHPYTELLLSSVPEMHPGWLEEALTHRRKVG